MTEQTQPTDAELEALLVESAPILGAIGDRVRASMVSAMRVAFAKWGTPAGAGEVAYLHDDGYWTPAKTEAGRKLSDRLVCAGSPKVAVYIAPQPTQAQAGAVPLTVDEVEQLIAQWSYELHGDRARYLVRMTEQHHGITAHGVADMKGGQDEPASPPVQSQA